MFGAEFQARKIYKVPAATFKGRSPIEAMGTLGTLGSGFQASYRIMGEAMPSAIVGFGGYPTLAPLLAAIGRGIPSAIHEQNSVMGQANRFLAPMVKAIACSFENTKYLEGKLLPKARITGTPLARTRSTRFATFPTARREAWISSIFSSSAAARAPNTSPT